MTKKTSQCKTPCVSNGKGSRIRRALQSKPIQEEAPRRSARLKSRVADVNLNVNSRTSMKRSGVHDTKLIVQGPDEFMPGLDNKPKIKRISVQSDKKRAMKKEVKVNKSRGKTCRKSKGKSTSADFVINLLQHVANDERLDVEKDKEGGMFSCATDNEKSKQGPKASSADDKETDKKGENISPTDGARHDHAGDLVSKLLENLVIGEKLDANDRTEKNKVIIKTPHKAKGACVESEVTENLKSTVKDHQLLNQRQKRGVSEKSEVTQKCNSTRTEHHLFNHTQEVGVSRESEVTQKLNSTTQGPHLFDLTQTWNPKVADSSPIHAVKLALHLSAIPESMVCREDEQEKVFNFCRVCIEQEKAGSLYVCGCPGTGKSLVIHKLKSLVMKWAKEAGISAPILVSINCTSLTDTSDVFRRILEQCQERKKDLDNVTPFYELKSLLCQRTQSSEKKMMLLILDEMDYLITRDQSVLYDLFSLPTFPHSCCLLIGVANAIDLTDRFLPKLQCLNCKPMVVTFRAYSKDQILRILQQRLMDLPYKVFQPQALELCARKVAAASGDMRKALFVCRGAVEMLEEEIRNSNSLSNIDSPKNTVPTKLSSPIEEIITKQDVNMVRLDHMARALAKTFRSAVVDTMQSLPQHQQMVLCSAVKLFRHGKKDARLGELNAAYLDLCKQTSINSLTVPEFSSMCRVLSDQALLNLGQAREDRLRRVTLKVDEGDVIFALQGIRLFRNCLQ